MRIGARTGHGEFPRFPSLLLCSGLLSPKKLPLDSFPLQTLGPPFPAYPETARSNRKSPIISPVLESGNPLTNRWEIVRETGSILPVSSIFNKPGLRPDQPILPIINARQEISPEK